MIENKPHAGHEALSQINPAQQSMAA